MLTGGISVKRTGHVVNLRPEKTLTKQVAQATARKIVRYRWKITGAVVLASAALILTHGFFARADIATFYPTSCLGGWINPQGAEGAPDVQSGNADDFNQSNSAYLTNAASQIFCGNFSGQLPKDTEPKKIVLKLSWVIKVPTAGVSDAAPVVPSPAVVDQNENVSSSAVNAT